MIRQTTTPSAASAPRHRLSGHYEALFRQLRFLQGGAAPPRTVGVTSCKSGEGVSTVAVNLAICGAGSGCRILLVDANTMSPSLARTLLVAPRPGLADLLSGEAALEECIRPTTTERLSILPAGPLSAADRADFDWSRLEEIIAQVSSDYELVIFDLPPVEALSPCLVVASLLDGVLLVVEAERTGSDAALRSKRQLCAADAKMLGVVLNKGR
ncbi:MAG: CpsD/CapB family tyrosine-protein kinase [Pirellulaceae bacterium]